ncbi:zinc-ribbon domain-containing protein [Staphylococcus debuckii]|uniref:zinc-ribbon domain-containing protein n=1 Tax=Staphylococcus debuckii TaxID=2044912 RepID=UPI000F438E5B|nr:zinc-ribbon domain-containing protein [Staphylococcus debuckii]AYU54220.1 zinc-ribbon domain-containing protein [Staphylococcus debuckii]
MYCPNCGAPVGPDDRFCGECGTDLTKSKPVAATAQKTEDQPDTSRTNSSAVTHAETQPEHHSKNEHAHQEPHTQPSNSNQQPAFDTDKFNQQANEIKHEGSTFFSKLLKSHDSVVAEDQPFSLKFIGILAAVFLIISLLVIVILVPQEVSIFGVSKASAVSNLFFSLILFIALGYGILALTARLTIKDSISFVKLLSDFVFVNTFSFILFIVGILLLRLEIISIGSFLTLLGIISFYSAAIYIITKYSSFHAIRIPVFFGILLYIALQLIVLMVYGEMVRNSLMETFKNIMDDFSPFGGGY